MFESGIFLVDKPAGLSSFKVVSKLRYILKIKKVGHAGTLDPFATGLLVACAGRSATKLISSIMEGEKEYIARIKLGIETSTQDPEGEIVGSRHVGFVSGSDIRSCLESFVGEQLQKPPAFSALKHKGKPLYYYARKGIIIEKPARPVNITSLERIDGSQDLSGENPEFEFRVSCSKGTYIRTLAADIGNALGCGGYLTGLRRTRSGLFSVEDSLSWSELCQDDAFDRCTAKVLNVADARKLLQ